MGNLISKLEFNYTIKRHLSGGACWIRFGVFNKKEAELHMQ